MKTLVIVLALVASSSLAHADDELPWRRVHGELAASYWLGDDERTVYGVGRSPGLRVTLGIGLSRNIDLNLSYRFVHMDSFLSKAVNEWGVGARYLIPRGSLIYFADLQLGLSDMRSNDDDFEDGGRSWIPGPEVSAGIAYQLNMDASGAILVGGGLEVIAVDSGAELEPYATIQLAFIAHFGDDD